MDHPITPLEAMPPVQPIPDRCAYCGAALDRRYYFCLTCGTPFLHPDAVVPLARPVELGEGELIARKAPHVWPLFWTYVIVVLGAAILTLPFGVRYDLRMIFCDLCILVTTCIFAARYWKSLAVQFRRIGFLGWPAWIALAGNSQTTARQPANEIHNGRP